MTPGRLLVISPHLDDAVLSCGELIAAHPGSVVATVFAGTPADGAMRTSWDAASGFTSAREALAARRAEDRAALALLGAQPHHLDFLDDQYGAAQDPAQISAALRAAIARHGADTVALPLGLFHRDHRRAADAALAVALAPDAPRGVRWLIYADALYRKLPDLEEARLKELEREFEGAGATLSGPEPGWPRALETKRRAIACYASQLKALASPGRPGCADALAPERYWRLAPAGAPSQRVAAVILTHNRADELLATLGEMSALPERPRLVVVDNGSKDGTAARVRKRFPAVDVIALPENLGAAARNAGVRHVDTPYVAFCDDDTAWGPGSLTRAVQLLDRHPRVALLCARVLVGAHAREDPTCREMAASPLPAEGLPGPALLGFLAGASIFRRAAFLEAGGYEPRFFIGAEEALLCLDLLSLGWRAVYCPELTVRHRPSKHRDDARRRRLLARNALLLAWLRRPWPGVLRRTLALAIAAAGDPVRAAGCLDALRELPWVARNRRVIAPELEGWCRLLERPRPASAPAHGARLDQAAETHGHDA